MSSYLDVGSGHSKRLNDIWDNELSVIVNNGDVQMSTDGNQRQSIGSLDANIIGGQLAAFDCVEDHGGELAERVKFPLPSERACVLELSVCWC